MGRTPRTEVASVFRYYLERIMMRIAQYLVFFLVCFTAACSENKLNGHWRFDDSIPDIVPDACGALWETNKDRPSVEEIDEGTWAFHFETFARDCAVYNSTIELSPDEEAFEFGVYRQRIEICNRCSNKQVVEAASSFELAESPPEEVVLIPDIENGLWGSTLGQPLIGIGSDFEFDFIANCEQRQRESVLVVPDGNYIKSIRVSRFPLETGRLYPVTIASSVNEFIGAKKGEPNVEFDSQLYLRVLWPRMVSKTTPLSAVATAFKPSKCKAYGWLDQSDVGFSIPSEFNGTMAYWTSPIQLFHLPDKLLERLPQKQ